MLPIIPLGPAIIPTAPLLYLLATYVGLSFVERAADAVGVDRNALYNRAALALLVAVVAARLVFVLQNAASFAAQPLSIIWPLTSGYNSAAGGLVGLLMLAWLLFDGRQPRWATLDALTAGALVMLTIISLADGLARSDLGHVTTLPWGVTLAGVRRHPVFVYEIVVGLAALLAWVRAGGQRPAGTRALWALAVYSGGRLFVDGFRAVTPLVGSYHLVQMVALGVLLVVMWVLGQRAGQKSSYLL